MAGPGKRGPAKGTRPKPPTVGANRGNAGKGRPKGQPNKATQKAREAISTILDGNVYRIQGWLDEVAAEDPKAAMNAVITMLEFGVPKLARTELTGLNGGPMQVADVSKRTDAELMEIINRPIQGQIGQASTIDVGANTARNATLVCAEPMDYTK